jgi:hypothetical protein
MQKGVYIDDDSDVYLITSTFKDKDGCLYANYESLLLNWMGRNAFTVAMLQSVNPKLITNSRKVIKKLRKLKS